MKFIVVFENEHFIILDKPSGVLTTPSRFAGEDERGCLGTQVQQTLGQQIFPVHRLDFEVSGLVVFAKTAVAHREANSWFEKRKIHKTYLAVTGLQDLSLPYTRPEKIEVRVGQEFTWKCLLLRGKKRSYESPAGKLSLTRAEVKEVDSIEKKIKWELMPLTGRPHQLRFELARHGFPIWGDQLYGSKCVVENNKIYLRAVKLNLDASLAANSFGFPPFLELGNGPETVF